MLKTAFVIVAGLMLLPGLAEASGKGGKGNATLVPAADVKWSDVPGRDGVQMAVLGGAPDKGASHFLIKFSPGTTVPLHFHNPDHYAYVVAGTMTFGADGKEVSLPPGSYLRTASRAPRTTASARTGRDKMPEGEPGDWQGRGGRPERIHRRHAPSATGGASAP
jgi:quercetin dioxygenase-like cupin family protein